MQNAMLGIRLNKVVVNIGIGSTEDKLDNAKALLKKLTGMEATHTEARKRMPEFNIRQGQKIGAMVTLRGRQADGFLRKALEALNGTLKASSVTDNSLSFGIHEYIEFSGVKYDPKIGMLGLNVNAAFSRRGARVALRKRARSRPGAGHSTIGREELLEYLSGAYGIKVAE
jgi:large subunit ribosomal protein L5